MRLDRGLEAVRSPPSTLYTCQGLRLLDWLGVASADARGFTDFDGFQQPVSAAAAQIFGFKSVAFTNFAIGANTAPILIDSGPLLLASLSA